MLGKRSDQRGLFEADYLYLDFVGRDSFYGFLAAQRGQMFRDDEFAAFYVLDNGRPSVPPSLLATVLLLQTHDRVSDEEAAARAAFDLRWKVALGIALDAQPFAKSTLQLFRAQLILHKQIRAVFQKSLTFARQTGYLKRKKIKVALDTSNILGHGAVKDTYNLLADGILTLARALARVTGADLAPWLAAHDLTRYAGSSLKGEAAIDWADARARQRFLNQIVADADRLLELARQALPDLAPDAEARTRLTEAAALLEQLLLQDVTRTAEGAAITQGVAADRVVSVEDPEMRHGRKSASKRFDGHKAAVAVDPDSQLITAATVLPGNAPDNTDALALVAESEENAQVVVEESIADCAYGDWATRQAFADADRTLIAKVPDRPASPFFVKEDFAIDPVAQTCICPAGQTCTTVVTLKSFTDRQGERQILQGFRFAAAVCAACPLRARCVRAGPGKGRTVRLHPQEALLQRARVFQRSVAFAPYRKLRQAAEHRIARLMQLGVRQARYVGRAKTLFQVLLAATVANLTLVATKTGLMRGRKGRQEHLSAHACVALVALLTAFTALIADLSHLTIPSHSQCGVFV
ncbi:MAG TPA: IS1182 family transposase [Chloroflexota bacterium]|nr:IS1182 family transposase [Chloroflexota bacterium]